MWWCLVGIQTNNIGQELPPELGSLPAPSHICSFEHHQWLFFWGEGAVLGLFCFALASLVAVGITLHCRAQALGMWASVVAAHRLSCPAACGILLNQGSNPCPLHWQWDSQPLEKSPSVVILY